MYVYICALYLWCMYVYMYVCMFVVADQLVAGLNEVCKDLSDVFLVRGQVPLDEAVEAQQPIGEKSEKRYL